MIKRKCYFDAIDHSFLVNPICALLGPRQCGKTTLSKQYSKEQESLTHFFDLNE
jgi:predicted AAA+ superfamily ATPase